MKLILRPNRNVISRIFSFRSMLHSSRTQHPTSLPDQNDTLQRRISKAGNPKASIIPVLDQWLDQGKQVKPAELQAIIKMLRHFKRFSHALEISEWMSNQRVHHISAGDFAVRLDLISKVRGLEEAEIYFESIPSDRRGYHTYGALLNCYAGWRMLEKAEAIMQKMRELGYIRGPLSYNVMLKLYNQLGKYEKVDMLLQEMEQKHIEPDAFTFNTRLQTYVAVSDVEGMEKFLLKREADPGATMGWHDYLVAANGYLKAGLTEKGLLMLKRSEQLIDPKSRKLAYEILMTVYAAAGKKEDVYRLWNLYKNMKIFYNTSYMSIISSLLKLDDIDAAEKLLEEWETEHRLFDIRVPRLLISAYCRNGQLEKAEAYLDRLIENGKPVDASTWEHMALGYKGVNDMEKAVENWKKAILASEPGWRPFRIVIDACLGYLKGQENVERVKEILRLFTERGHLSADVCDQLLNNMNEGKLSSKIIDSMRRDRRFGGTREDEDSLYGETERKMEL